MATTGNLQIAAAQATPYLLMKDNGSGKLTPTTAANDTVLGVLLGTGAADDYVKLELGAAKVKLRAQGAIAFGNTLVPSASANGSAKATDGASQTIVGFALQAAADGDEFWAFVYANKLSTT